MACRIGLFECQSFLDVTDEKLQAIIEKPETTVQSRCASMANDRFSFLTLSDQAPRPVGESDGSLALDTTRRVGHWLTIAYAAGRLQGTILADSSHKTFSYIWQRTKTICRFAVEQKLNIEENGLLEKAVKQRLTKVWLFLVFGTFHCSKNRPFLNELS